MIELLFFILFFGVGCLVGLLFFLALQRSLRLLFMGEAIGQICMLYILRFGVAGVFFFVAARGGVLDLAAAAAGFTVARFFVVSSRGA